MVYGDLHLHSLYSNRTFPFWVLNSPDQILKKAVEVGLKVVALTDHDSLRGSFEARKIAKNYDLIAISACEVTTQEGHLLAFGLHKEIPKNLSASQAIKMIHQQGGLACPSHPFRKRLPLFPPIGLNEKVFDLPIDGLEVCNASMSEKINGRASKALKEKRWAEIGGSDAHVLEFVGYGRTIFPDGIKTEEDVLRSIRRKLTKPYLFSPVPEVAKYATLLRDQLKYFFL